MNRLTILQGDCREVLKTLPDESVQCCVTSPPYWGLRDYGHEEQIGQEQMPWEYIETMTEVFRQVKRVLRDDGTVWINLGDSYAGHNQPGWRAGNEAKNGGASNKNGVGFVSGLKPKDLIGIPWRVAMALQDSGWYLRSDIIWHKPNPMPESVTDRPTKAHEYLFLLTKNERYFYDAEAIKEPFVYPDDQRKGDWKLRPNNGSAKGSKLELGTESRMGNGDNGRNRRSVWTVPTSSYPESHFATFPPDLIKPCILAGTKPGDTVLDPFAGSGTTGQVALELGRRAVLIELNPDYVKLCDQRCNVTPGLPI